MGRVSIFISFAICMISIWQTCDADHSKILSPCPGPVYCSDNTQCKIDEACLLPKVGTQKRCRRCNCADPSQCYTDVDGSVSCDCTGSSSIGPFCTCQPCLGSCPSGYVQYGGTCSCYRVSKNLVDRMYGNMECEMDGAFLAKISSDGENAFILDLAKASLPNTMEQAVWLGGNDLDVEGNWVWDMDGSPINGMYNRWTGSGPDNNSTENCLEMLIYGGDDGLWNENTCMTFLRYVCEFFP